MVHHQQQREEQRQQQREQQRQQQEQQQQQQKRHHRPYYGSASAPIAFVVVCSLCMMSTMNGSLRYYYHWQSFDESFVLFNISNNNNINDENDSNDNKDYGYDNTAIWPYWPTRRRDGEVLEEEEDNSSNGGDSRTNATNTTTTNGTTGKLIAYSFLMPFPKDEKIPFINYFLCPVTAMLQRYGHDELRVMGVNTKYNASTSTFSGNFLDGTQLYNHPVGGNRNVLKTHFFYSVLNTTITRNQDNKIGDDATSSSIKYEPDPEDTILFVDGLDVLFVRDPAPLADAWKRHRGASDGSGGASGSGSDHGPGAYFAGERNCHPFTCKPKGFCVGRGHTYTIADGERIPGEEMCNAMQRKNIGRFSYGNTGFIWGSAAGLRTMYDTLPKVLESESTSPKKLVCDQGMLQLLQLKYPQLLGMDTEQRWGYMGAGDNFTAEYGYSPQDIIEKSLYTNPTIRDKWPTSIINDMKPVALHFNGDSRYNWQYVKQYVRYKLLHDKRTDPNLNYNTTTSGEVQSSWINVDNNGERVQCSF